MNCIPLKKHVLIIESIKFLSPLPRGRRQIINGKQTLNYNDVLAALVNYEARRKDMQSSSNGTSAVTLMVKGRGSNQKGKGER